MKPVLGYFGSPKGPRRHPKSGTFLGGPKMRSKIALGGGPSGLPGPSEPISEQTLRKIFSNRSVSLVFEGMMARSATISQRFLLFFFELLTASFRARGAQEAKNRERPAYFFKKQQKSLRGVSCLGGRRQRPRDFEIQASINLPSELISSAIYIYITFLLYICIYTL